MSGAAEVLDLDERRLPARQQGFDHFAVVSAEINQQVETALRHPRSVDQFQKRLRSQALLNAPIAAQCTYKLPRGGKEIVGPSVRFMEMVLANWGNCRVGAQIIAETETEVIAQGVFHDLESNAAITITATRSIVGRNKQRFDADMISVTKQAVTSIAVRNVIQKGVPKALWHQIWEESRRVALGDLTTLAERRNNALEWFRAVGVTEKQICEKLEVVGVADIGLEQLATLGGFKVAIEEDSADPEDIFPAVESKTASTRGKKATQAKAPTPPADAQADDKKPDDAANQAKAADAVAGDTGAGASSGPKTTEAGGAPPAPSAQQTRTGAAASAGPASVAIADYIRTLPGLKVVDKETADDFARSFLRMVDTAETQQQVDDLLNAASTSGQWQALQKHDIRQYGSIASRMGERADEFEG